MVGNLIIRGILVGIVAGLIAFGWAKAFGEPSVDAAIAYETAHADPAAAEEPELFSRDVQSGIGLLTGMVIVGAGMGGIFGVVFAFAYGRLGNLGAAPTSALLAFFGWVSIYLIPSLKYPASPPATSDPETIKYRTALFFIIMAVSIAATVGALILRQNLRERLGGWYASLAAAGAYLVVLAVFFWILPSYNEVPEDFSATVLWNFRLGSLGTQLVLWAAIGLLFGTVVERTMFGTTAPATPQRRMAMS